MCGDKMLRNKNKKELLEFFKDVKYSINKYDKLNREYKKVKV